MTSENAAPAEMPGEREIAAAIYQARNGKGCVHWSRLPHSHQEPYLSDARAVLALFAPILAEKEREIERACADHAHATIGWERERGLKEAAEAALAAEREKVAVLRQALDPFAAIADIFDQPSANRPREGEIMGWVDHRVGERFLTVEMLRAARAAAIRAGE